MGTTKTLMDHDAIKKIIDLAKDQMCLLCTYSDGHIVSRPMSTSGIDDDGSIWFMSRNDSEKNRQIEDDAEVYLMYMNNGKSEYLSLSGTAEIIHDKKKTEELWTPIAKAWFEQGVDDPELSLIKVTVDDGHYWDTKNGKLVSLLKIAAAVVTGKGMDGGIDGALKL